MATDLLPLLPLSFGVWYMSRSDVGFVWPLDVASAVCCVL